MPATPRLELVLPGVGAMRSAQRTRTRAPFGDLGRDGGRITIARRYA